MSQLPRYGGQGTQNVKTTTTKTTRIPGTSTTVTQTKTVVADVNFCGTEKLNDIKGAQGAISRSGGTGLRQPSSGARQAPPAGHPVACDTTSCDAGPPRPTRPTGLPQVRGLPRPASAMPAPGQRPAVQQTRAGGLPQPQAKRLQQPTRQQPPQAARLQQPTGLQQPQATRAQQPIQTGRQPQTAMGLQQSRGTGMQRPAPCGLQQPKPVQRMQSTGLQQPQVSGLQRPMPSGMQQQRTGMSRPVTSQSQPRPTGGLPQPMRRSPMPPPSSAAGGCRAACSSGFPAKPTVSLAVEPPTPVRGPAPRRRNLPQTPVQVHGDLIAPSAPARRTERPRGPEAYKQFIFDSKYKLKMPKTPGLAPVPGTKRRRAATAEERANRSLTEKSQANLGAKVTARAANISPGQVQFIDTPSGKERILKQTVLEKRVERDEEGEKIVKNLQIVDAETGAPKVMEMNLQQLDPSFALLEGKEVISITSKVSVSETHTTVSQEMTRATTSPVPEAANMPPEQIAKLVEEENEDVDNTLKMLPPDLTLSPGRYEMKKRLQHLQLNSESVALLEQSITHPEPRADEAQLEPTPEVMAVIMHTVEKGVPPQSTPDQVFNTLFVETSNEHYIKLSPITQGPLQDVVVPTEVPLDVHKEVISDDMEKLTERLQNIPTAAELPMLDIFDQVMAEDKKSPSKGRTKDLSFRPISDETSLWVNANLEHLVNVVGATPVEVLDPANVEELQSSGTLQEQMATGVEYFVEADPVQYMSRVQLRGTQLPSYFPGYLVALPDFPDVVKLASSPDEVFASAWKSVQPKYFPDESMQSLIY